MQVVLDYLTMSFKSFGWQQIANFLGLGDVVMMETKGRYGWENQLFYRGTHIYFGGRDDCCLELSGTGCRTLEELSGNTFDWFQFLKQFEQDIRSGEVNVSRVDIAADDREGALNFRRMIPHCKHGRYICKAKWRIWIDGDEQAIYFGSPKSDRRLRIYNKAMEQGIGEHWLRVEMQMRDVPATSFLLNWFLSGDIGFCYAGVLRDYLRFTTSAPDGSHYDRAMICPWWSRFVGSVGKLPQLYIDGGQYDLMDVERFIQRQCASSLKLFLRAHNGDVSDLLDIMDRAQLNRRQQMLLDKLRITGIIEE